MMMSCYHRSIMKKVQSATIATVMCIASLAGILAVLSPAVALVEEDKIVTTSELIEDATFLIYGNLRIESGGELTIRNSEIIIISDGTHPHSVTVDDGTLIIDGSIITTHLDRINPYPFLNMNIQNRADVRTSNDSVLRFPGNIIIDGASTTVVLRNTNITAMEIPSDLYQTGAETDLANDGPAISINDANVEMYDSKIWKLPEYPTAGSWGKNLTLTGTAQLTAVNSFLDVDFHYDTDVMNKLVLQDSANAYLYGCTFDTSGVLPWQRTHAVLTDVGGNKILKPTAQDGANDTTAGENVQFLWEEDDLLTYRVEPSERMSVADFDTSDLPPGATISSVTLVIKYTTWSYDGAGSIEYAIRPGVFSSLGVTPVDGQTNQVEMIDLLSRGVDTLGEIADLAIGFTHTGTTGYVGYDVLYLSVIVGPQAYIYRWADITLQDEYGIPLEDATITAKFNSTEELSGKTAIYYSSEGLLQHPPSNVTSYLGKTDQNYNISDIDGKLLVPYLTDILNGNTTSYNASFVGTYNFTAESGSFSSSIQTSFDPYPAMNSESTMISMNISIEGAEASPDDPSRYLIVPPDITLSDGFFTHGGDIFVKPGGELTIENMSFTIDPIDASSSRILVYNGGTLRIINSSIEGTVPVSLQIKDGGSLIVQDSQISNAVSMDIHGDASIQISGSDIDGSLSTASDSAAALDIVDSNLATSPIIDGDSVANLVNATAPSIDLNGQAKAIIFRWVFATILDGAGNELPDADVSAHFQLNETTYVTETTDANGTAKLKALAVVLNSSDSGVRSTYYGNYKVNASYTYNSIPYLSGFSNIALQSDTEPLLSVNPLIELDVPGALPDFDPPIFFDPDPPVSQSTCEVSALVSNNGVVDAWDVLVYFYDSDDADITGDDWFASYVISYIPAGGSEWANVTWITNYVAGSVRYFGVEVDPLDDIPELNDSDNFNYEAVTIVGMPDLVITSSNVELGSGGTYFTEGIAEDIEAIVQNTGDEATPTSFEVTFFHDDIPIGTEVTNPLGAGQSRTISITWDNPQSVGSLVSIKVAVNPPHAFAERSYDNNNVTVNIPIETKPDLEISELDYDAENATAGPRGGHNVTFHVKVYNSGGSAITEDVPVAIYQGAAPSNETYVTHEIISTIYGQGEVTVSIEVTLPSIEVASMDMTYWAIVNPDNTQGGFSRIDVESDYGNNDDSVVITVLDARADLYATAEDIRFLVNDAEKENIDFGDTVNAEITVRNNGFDPAEDFNISLVISGKPGEITEIISDYLLISEFIDDPVYGSDTLVVSIIFSMQLTIDGNYTLNITLDANEDIVDKNRSNNVISKNLTLSYIAPQISITPPDDTVRAGEIIIITGTVRYPNDNVWPNMDVDVYITTTMGENVTSRITDQTDSNGGFSVNIQLPADMRSGDYNIRVDVGKNSEQVTIEVIGAAGGLALWLWILIFVGIAALAVIILSLLVFRRGIGKLVECGECGALIPETARRCPKCGVEFEEDMVKCSECGAWIPASSIECPNCHVRFGAPPDEEIGYEDKMKSQYEDTVLSKYRELAKADLGSEYSDETFRTWWEANPAYISFEDWLAKEEEKRKEVTPVVCKICGTPNAQGSTICQNCGSPLPVGKLKPIAVEKMPPESVVVEKKVIRKPIDRKIVPKKVIKKPIDRDQEGEPKQ